MTVRGAETTDPTRKFQNQTWFPHTGSGLPPHKALCNTHGQSQQRVSNISLNGGMGKRKIDLAPQENWKRQKTPALD